MIVEIIDPYSHLLHSKLYSSEGRFTFTAHSPGDYRICLSSNSSAWFGGELLVGVLVFYSSPQRVHLDIGVGDHAQNYAEIASREKLSDLQLRVRQLLDQVEMISKDQSFQRVREEYFRDLSESTNRRVTWWSIAQFILLVIIGIWQMRHLRSFFQAKKLV
ncbi:unnamed protein product [Protopolystoma xenopodis]|uniref:GOLD domain-containing protein n=1 Tax=Protopolystoma xenopodis TaxID=117903 RepID=A0A448X429_9PLAT|nr:unnamed protein product [Protopolystoma xenopodis]